NNILYKQLNSNNDFLLLRFEERYCHVQLSARATHHSQLLASSKSIYSRKYIKVTKATVTIRR
ncbi:MAG: hypothetical protein AAF620_07495, partial [Bacteroidota bacterium]